jgi:two-component system cell cycle response regulator DivK
MSKRILVVEDDLLNRMLLCAVLEKAGFGVHSVTDGALVLDRTREFVPNLVTMDINLPNISGLELIKTLKADPKLCQIPILAVTAYVGKGEEARVRNAGANDFLTKPISIRPFLAAVNRLLFASGTELQPVPGTNSWRADQP